MRGFVDLHCHYLPGIDDGVREEAEGVHLCQNLHAIGFDVVVATPHIRTAMFENRKPGLMQHFAAFSQANREQAEMPHLGLGAEHYFDDLFWQLFAQGEAVPYPGGNAVLVELPRDRLPLRLADRFFDMRVRGVTPVLAHPERYRPFFRTSDSMVPLLEVGALPLLDVMSLTGKYGRSPRKAAERMLGEGVYYAACSDSHRPEDVDIVARAIELLERRVGREGVEVLLADHPRRILEGRIRD